MRRDEAQEDSLPFATQNSFEDLRDLYESEGEDELERDAAFHAAPPTPEVAALDAIPISVARKRRSATVETPIVGTELSDRISPRATK